MEKKTASSYVKMFKEKIELKDSKAKHEEGPAVKGINFDNLADWDDIVEDKDNDDYNALMNRNELRGEDVYRPSLQKIEIGDNINSNADAIKEMNQVKLMPGIIKEEEEELKNSSRMINDQYSGDNDIKEKDSLDLSDRIANRIDDECNITQNQMNELNEEMNQMVKETKVKSYVEKKLDKGINVKKLEEKVYLKQKKAHSNPSLKDNQKAPNQNTKQEDNNKQFIKGNNNAEVIQSSQLNNYPQTYLLQMQYNPEQIQAQPIKVYQNANSYPYQIQNNHQPIYPFNQMPMNINPNMSIQNQNQNANYSNSNIPLINPNYYQQQMQPIQSHIIINNNSNQSSLDKPIKANVIPQYCPKTMKEYKEKYNVPKKKLGGLGANIGTKEWEEKQQKVKKIKEYSSKIKEENRKERSGSLQKHITNNNNNNSGTALTPHLIPVKCLNNKQEEILKNQLLNDSLDEDDDNDKTKTNQDIKENLNKNISQNYDDQMAKTKGSNSHINVMKKLKKEKEQMKSKDNNAKKKNNIYTTMKQPKIAMKKIQPINNKPKQESYIKENNKRGINDDDELTEKFMKMPCNNVIENLLQNHRAYNDKVDQIKMYLK